MHEHSTITTMTEENEASNNGGFSRGQDGELIWSDRLTKTTVSLSKNGEQKLDQLGVNLEKFVQNLATFGGIRIHDNKQIGSPSFVGTVAQVEGHDDPEKAEQLFDLITELMRSGELKVDYYG